MFFLYLTIFGQCDCTTVANQRLNSYSLSDVDCVKIDKCLFADINLLSSSKIFQRASFLGSNDDNSIVLLSNIDDISITTTTFINISTSSGVIMIKNSKNVNFHQICGASITSSQSAFIDFDSKDGKASMTYSTQTRSTNNFLNLKIQDFSIKGLNLSRNTNGGIVANCNSHFEIKESGFGHIDINSKISDSPDSYGGKRLAIVYTIADHAIYDLINVYNNSAKGERGNDSLFLLDDFLESTFEDCYFLQNKYQFIFDIKKDSENRHETNYTLTIEDCIFSESEDEIMANLRLAGIMSHHPPILKKKSKIKIIRDDTSFITILNDNTYSKGDDNTYTLSFLNTAECQAKFTYSDVYHPTKKPLMAGHIIAIVFVCLAVLALIIELIIFLTLGKKKREKMGDESQLQLADDGEDDKSMIRMSILD
ncbi:hypothetical protein M9Y10_004486 [Tritrichomonas musculus]|uniref:Right handed beta helix domain-containing protein n=1 Tax=Tritrichomonas musculus TaxID=1915356 RepID=A0ABR2JS62_9EUKA